MGEEEEEEEEVEVEAPASATAKAFNLGDTREQEPANLDGKSAAVPSALLKKMLAGIRSISTAWSTMATPLADFVPRKEALNLFRQQLAPGTAAVPLPASLGRGWDCLLQVTMRVDSIFSDNQFFKYFISGLMMALF